MVNFSTVTMAWALLCMATKGNSQYPLEQGSQTAPVIQPMLPPTRKIDPLLTIPCTCALATCSCCANFNIPGMNANQVGCGVLTFDEKDLGVEFKLDFAGFTLYENAASVVNPPAVCVPLPNIPAITFCGKLHDLRFGDDLKQGCLTLSVQAIGQDVVSVPFDCVKLTNGAFGIGPAQ